MIRNYEDNASILSNNTPSKSVNICIFFSSAFIDISNTFVIDFNHSDVLG